MQGRAFIIQADSRACRELRPFLERLGSGPQQEHDLQLCATLDRPVIAIAEHSSEDLAIAALRSGVRDYFKCPIPWREFESSLLKWMPAVGGPAPACEPNGPLANIGLVGESTCIRNIRQQVCRLAAVDSMVLITGETGTGKELVAQSIHQLSTRSKSPFVSINCAAIPDTLLESELFGHERGAFTGANQTKRGMFESSAEGTIFLDEVGDMSAYSQAKILRVLETREVNRLGGREAAPLRCRFIAATNQELERSVADSRFRKDLFFRLNVTRVELAPLRERKQDIPTLCQHFVNEFNRRFGTHVRGLEKELLDLLCQHDWPGNVRELRNFLEATFANSPSPALAIVDVPDFFRRIFGHTETRNNAERERLLSALTACRWNKSLAAKAMHCSRMTLYRRMSKYEIGSSQCTVAATNVTSL